MTSVIIPAYNCGRYLSYAVKSALYQTYSDIEVIIVVEPSPDNTLKTAKQFADKDNRVRIITNETRLGAANSRNRGIKASHGEFIAFLDADDVWLPKKLEVQLRLLESGKCDICCTAYSFIDEHGSHMGRVYSVPKKITRERMLFENVIGCSSAAFSKKAAANITMNPSFSHEDYVFWLDMLSAGATVMGINRPLMLYRKTTASRSADKFKAARDRFDVYRNHLGLSLADCAKYFSVYAVNAVFKHIQ
jgi:teichuronic acid biosynthesis glycosyltransferase TuaG